MGLRNRLLNANNEYQNMNKHQRVLCVCSAGLLRSPTAAHVLCQPPYNYNTRAAGLDESFALVCVDEVLLEWADKIVTMNEGHRAQLREKLNKLGIRRPIKVLNIPDDFGYRDPELIELIHERYKETEYELGT